MNDYHSRYAESLLERALGVSPVVVLMGARQTGKTTLVRRSGAVGRDRAYATLDDLETQAWAAEDADGFLRRASRLTIDEVQRSPDLLLAIKRAVDEEGGSPGRFVLTGSANLLLMRRVAESLAGRATYLTLWPLTLGERHGDGTVGAWSELLAQPVEVWPERIAGRPTRKVDWKAEVARGGYPVPSLRLTEPDQRALWFDGYTRTYLERDLQDLAAIDNLVDFRRLMRAACLRVGQLLNQAELGRDIRLPRPTVHRYLNLLETSYQLARVETYAVNRTKRLIKTPKVFWSDTGLAEHLAGRDEPTGSGLENLVLMDLLAWRDATVPRPEVLYWRTATGLEVDFVIEAGRRLVPIEVKSGSRPRRSDTKALRAFREEYADLCPGGLLLHTGDETEWLGDGILAAPLAAVL